MRDSLKTTIFLLLLCIIPLLASAQTTEVWFHIGTSMNAYKGDLSGYEQYNAAFHVGAQLNRKERLNGNVNLGFGALRSENRNFTGPNQNSTPNRFFKSNFFYINYDLHYNFIKKDYFILYLSLGIGIMRFNPQDDLGNDLQGLPDTRAEEETYRNITLMLPTSLGVIYLLPNQYGIALQAGLANTLTDYLDNISALGNDKNDNILSIRFALYVPVQYKVKD